MAIPKVEASKCDGCGNCVDVCPADVFEIDEDKAVVVRPDDCVECMACLENCPTEAITID